MTPVSALMASADSPTLRHTPNDVLERAYRETESESRRDDIARYMRELKCPSCGGKRLKPEALAVKIEGHSIIDLTRLPVGAARFFGCARA